MLEFKVTLRVFSRELQLIEIEKKLGSPTKGFSIGDPFLHGRKNREETYWSLESSRDPHDSFESHLSEVIDFISNKESDLRCLQNTCKVDLFCMLSSNNGQGSAALPVSIISRLAKYNLDVTLDVYADYE